MRAVRSELGVYGHQTEAIAEPSQLTKMPSIKVYRLFQAIESDEGVLTESQDALHICLNQTGSVADFGDEKT
jgi:hypothetical protein